jgi:transposase InsO family protein
LSYNHPQFILSDANPSIKDDKAPAESWFATLKVECVDVVYETKEHARTELFEYMEVFYNRQRLHSKLNYLSPVAFEQQHHQLLNEAQSLVH